MPRTTKGPATRARRKKLLKNAKGFCRGRNVRFRIAKETVMRALRYARRDRRQRKRQLRALWIQRIAAACEMRGFKYSLMIHGLNQAGIELDRKMLAWIATQDEDTFSALVDIAKENSARTNLQAA